MWHSKLTVFLTCVIFISDISANPLHRKTPRTCQACHETVEGKINVHLVPHSHDDVGWLKTFAQYYKGTGSFTRYEDAGVRYIISSTVKALKKKSDRRFIQVETAFFWKWWLEQNNETRQDVIDLVNFGQLEMINGAWSMNDEAATHYQSIIDQFTWGFRILQNTVGECGKPKIGWQIDPFGHSREHASLLKQFGFEGLVIGRLDHRDKDRRIDNRSLDFMWKSSSNFENSELFTTMFPDFYGSEIGYRFDIMYGDTINDDNLDSKISGFADILDNYKTYYQTSNIMMPMGNDFTYQVAEVNFQNMDKLIKGFKNHETYNVFYSTPSCYIAAVQKEVENNSISLETKTDDFFPYAMSGDKFWTGYFTSRPTLKRFERTGNNILQTVKQLTTFSRILDKEYDIATLDLRQAMGVLQHHDAITGTEKQAVADDYAKMLHKAIKQVEEPVGAIILDLLKKDEDVNVKLQFSTCLLSNVSICSTSQKDSFVLAVQNPLPKTINRYIHLPVNHLNFSITGPSGVEPYEIFDTLHPFDHVQTEEGKPSSKELVFLVRDLPPLGINLYLVHTSDDVARYTPFEEVKPNETSFGNTYNGFSIDADSGKLNSVTLMSETIEMTQDFYYYTTRYSGAYIFSPAANEPALFTDKINTKCARGIMVHQCLQIVSDEVSQIIRVYTDNAESYIEFDWLVGDLKDVNPFGKEVITRYTTKDFNNNKTFYTDSNGREMMQRILNHRNDFNYDPSSQPVSSNYYPVTSRIVLKDEVRNLEVAIMNDRAQGGTSLDEGVIELMLHRKLMADDWLGVNEVLREKQYGKGTYARGKHWLIFGNISSDNAQSTATGERIMAQSRLLEPVMLFAEASTDILEALESNFNLKFEGLRRSLPANVHILTLEPWIDCYILRLEHILEKGEDDNLSIPVTVDLNGLFTLFSVTEISETTLGANEVITANMSDFKITLNPMEIRTFLFKTYQNNIGGHDDSDNDDNDNDDVSGRSNKVKSKGAAHFPGIHRLAAILLLNTIIANKLF